MTARDDRAAVFASGRCPGCDGRCGIGFLRSTLQAEAPADGAAAPIPTRALALGACTVFGLPLAATAIAALVASWLGLGDWVVPSVLLLVAGTVVALRRP